MRNFDNADARRNIVGLNIKRTLCYIVLIFLTIISVFPFVILLINSTRSASQISFGFSMIPGKEFINNVKGVFDPGKKDTLPMASGFINSFIISTAVTVLTTYFSTLTAYAIHAYNFKLKKAAFTFIMLIMMVPTQVSAIGFYLLMYKFDLIDTYWPLIIPSIAAPSTFFFIKQYMESSLPLEIVEAARIDGSGEFGTFNRIIVPIMKPAIAVQAIFAFVTTWNTYFMPALIINSTHKKTVPILIFQLRSASFDENNTALIYTTVLSSILPLIVIYLLLSKFIIRGIALGSVKG